MEKEDKICPLAGTRCDLEMFRLAFDSACERVAELEHMIRQILIFLKKDDLPGDDEYEYNK